MTTYLDCNATTPVDPRVAEAMLEYLCREYGNAGSRTHEFGTRASQAVENARKQVAEVVEASPDEVVFTSGATESNNIGILGLLEHGKKTGRKHIVSTEIEHKAVLEPLAALSERGFEITLVKPRSEGFVDANEITSSVRADTLLVSVMHVNNETGVIQPVEEIAEGLLDHETFFHVDAAQGFGKLIGPLRNHRIDLISVSGHKIYGPKGVGALIARRRKYRRPPLTPILFGGGQERGLRPGTQPVHQVVGLGEAATVAIKEHGNRAALCSRFQTRLRDEMAPLRPEYVGDQDRVIFNTASVRFKNLDSEAVMVALKGIVAVSNGSACTSANYAPSHVLLAMGMGTHEASEVIRFSWYHETPEPDWGALREAIQDLR